MSVNLLDAFSFLFKQKNWFVKSLIGSLLFFFIKIISLSTDVIFSDSIPKLTSTFVSNQSWTTVVYILLHFGALVLIMLSIWMLALVMGYLVTTVRRYMRGQEDAVPDWDEVMGKLFKRGLKTVILFFFLPVFGLGIWYTFTLFWTFIWATIAPFSAMLGGVIFLFCSVYVIVLLPAMFMSFCEKDRFVQAFNLIRARQLVLKAPAQYALTLFLLVVLSFVTALIILMLFMTKVGILVLPIVCFYLFVVMGNVIGQYYVAHCKEQV